jgi:hypothetical protein
MLGARWGHGPSAVFEYLVGRRPLPCQPGSVSVRWAQPGGWRSEPVPTRPVRGGHIVTQIVTHLVASVAELRIGLCRLHKMELRAPWLPRFAVGDAARAIWGYGAWTRTDFVSWKRPRSCQGLEPIAFRRCALHADAVWSVSGLA